MVHEPSQARSNQFHGDGHQQHGECKTYGKAKPGLNQDGKRSKHKNQPHKNNDLQNHDMEYQTVRYKKINGS